MMRAQATLGIGSLIVSLACAGCGGSTSAPSSRGPSGGAVTHQAPPTAHRQVPSTSGAAVCGKGMVAPVPQSAPGSANLLPCYKVALPLGVRRVVSP
jgi:hypothetical protein